jgi:hypothetical protein
MSQKATSLEFLTGGLETILHRHLIEQFGDKMMQDFQSLIETAAIEDEP